MPRSERVRRQGLEPRTRGLRVRSLLCYLVPLVLSSPKHMYFVPVDGATACRLVPLVLCGLWRPSTHGAPRGRPSARARYATAFTVDLTLPRLADSVSGSGTGTERTGSVQFRNCLGRSPRAQADRFEAVVDGVGG